MKRFLLWASFIMIAASAFAIEPQKVGSSHAQDGYDSKDIVVTVAVNLGVEGRLWLSAGHSYPMLFSERDKLVRLVQIAARKVDIAIANKTTISFVQELGRFYTEDASLVTVSFETDGYGSSYTVIQISGKGDNVILLLNKKDSQDFLSVVGGLVDDFQRQKALFNEGGSYMSTSTPSSR
jgi:hypothetical protein